MATSRPFLRPSSNEVDRIMQEERKKRRILRIQQVRAQSRNEAMRILREVKNEEAIQKNIIEKKVRRKCLEEKENDLRKLENKYEIALEKFGEAHKNAQHEEKLLQAHKERTKKDRDVAIKRGALAVKKVHENQNAEFQKKDEEKRHKRNVLLVENRRAQKVASFPTPPRLKNEKIQPAAGPKKVAFYEAGTYTTSSYLPKEDIITKEKNNLKEPGAREIAKKEAELAEEIRLQQKKKEEMHDKMRRERGEAARKREAALQLQTKLLQELSQADHLHELPCLDEEIKDLYKDETEHKAQLLKETETKAKKILQELDLVSKSDTSESKSLANSIGSFSESTLTESFETSHSEHEISSVSEKSHLAPLESTLHSISNLSHKESLPVDDRPFTKKDFLPQRVDSSPKESCNKSDDKEKPQKPLDHDFEQMQRRVEKLYKKVTSNRVSYTDSAAEDEMKLINENLEKLKEGNKRVGRMIKDYKAMDRRKLPQHTSKHTTTSESDLDATESTTTPTFISSDDSKQCLTHSSLSSLTISSQSRFLTPVRHYNETLKEDGSGQRLRSKREKFEATKKELIRHYIKKILGMRPDDLDLITASSVEGSGVDLSNVPSLGSLTPSSCSGNASSQSQSVVSESSRFSSLIKVDDLDQYPSKLSSIVSESKDSIRSIPSSTISSHFDQDAMKETLFSILKRLEYANQLKRAAFANQDGDVTDHDANAQLSIETKNRTMGTTLTDQTRVSSDIYPQYTSRSDSSGFMDQSSACGGTSSILQKLSKKMLPQSRENFDDSCNHLRDKLKNFEEKRFTSTSQSESQPEDGSSSAPSIPDMADVLKKFIKD